MERCIIFIPGFRGSSLYNEKGRLVWPNFLRTQFTRNTLNHDLPELGFPNADQYYPGDILRTVPILTRAYSFDVYGDFVNELTQRFSDKSKIVTFHYDWRDHLSVTAAKLTHQIAQLRAQGITQFDIIGHSMGGLIASYLLRHGHDASISTRSEWGLASLIHKMVFVGTPFQGSMKVLHDLNQGTTVGINRTLFSPFSLCTLPSVYYLLPHERKISHASARVRGNQWCLSDIDTWERFQFGIFNPAVMDIAYHEQRRIFLHHCLASARQFHHALNAPSEQRAVDSVKLISVTSEYDNVVSGLDVQGDPHQYHWQYEMGDGSLPLSSTALPEPFSVFERRGYRVNSEHSQMLADKHVQAIMWTEMESVE